MDKIDEVLAWQRQHAKENFVPIIRDESARILCEEVKEVAPKRILEVGTATGYSAILMLKSAPDAMLVTVEKDAFRQEIAKKCFEKAGLGARVESVLGDANEFVKTLAGKFDFVFLDGPKSHYIKQLPYLLEALNDGGVIVADNVLFMGAVLSDEYPAHKHRTTIFRLREFLEAVQKSPALETKLLEVEEGLLICRKR